VNPAGVRVILVRHAHADWPDYHGRDFERPLTPRGSADAARTAAAIKAAGLAPAVLLVSPALRTRQTAAIIAAALGLSDDCTQFVESLYNASAQGLEAELRRSAPNGDTIMLVAHNPGISELGRQLAGDRRTRPFAPADWRQFVLPAE
jgi:phosphohistidine phosphatase